MDPKILLQCQRGSSGASGKSYGHHMQFANCKDVFRQAHWGGAVCPRIYIEHKLWLNATVRWRQHSPVRGLSADTALHQCSQCNLSRGTLYGNFSVRKL